MTIAYQIWKGKTHEDLGLPLGNWEARKRILEAFLDQWVGEEETFDENFIAYLKQYQHLPPGSVPGSLPQQAPEPPPEMPHGLKLVQNFGDSMATWAKSGFKMTTDEEAKRRFDICLECEFLQNGERCLKCGCWMKYKSKLEAMTCKANKW